MNLNSFGLTIMIIEIHCSLLNDGQKFDRCTYCDHVLIIALPSALMERILVASAISKCFYIFLVYDALIAVMIRMWWYVDSVPVVVVVWWCLYTHTFHPPAPGNISRNMPWSWSRPLALVSLVTGMQEHNCCYQHGFSFIIILLVITSIYKIYRYWGFYLAFHSMP